MDSLRVNVFILFFLAVFSPLYAQLSPGPLHKSHAFLEGVENCTKCHPAGKRLSAEKCLDCHTLIRKERISQSGLHGHPEYARCQKCHIEHQGRKAPLIYWKNGQNRFDHSLTGFRLKGAHKKLKCRQCHTAKFIIEKSDLLKNKKDLKHTFLGLDKKCLSCHADEHHGQFKNKQCLSCHTMKGWKPASRFDHEKTEFPLTGRHKKIKCSQCHHPTGNQQKPKNKLFAVYKIKNFKHCIDCHNDIHNGQLGKKCSTCHTTKSWKQYNKTRFNHDLTTFPLRGKHRTLACTSCHHSKKTFKIQHFNQCKDCHQDRHLGQFDKTASGGRCEVCHTEQSFIPSTFTLKQHEKSRFPLKGAHLAVACNDCHKMVQIQGQKIRKFQFTTLSCQTCHKDKHNGEFRKWVTPGKQEVCTVCHTVQNWHTINFDHSRTNFPLLGKHKKIACGKCHIADQAGVIHLAGLKTGCVSCHKDAHGGQFTDSNGIVRCERCHTPESWQAKKFDHNRMARFKLTGAHRNVPCAQCHHKERYGQVNLVHYKPLDISCESCHGRSKAQ